MNKRVLKSNNNILGRPRKKPLPQNRKKLEFSSSPPPSKTIEKQSYTILILFTRIPHLSTP